MNFVRLKKMIFFYLNYKKMSQLLDVVSLVFASISQKKARKLLIKNEKKWLIRESASIPGMLTVDILRPNGETHAYRYAYYFEKNKWKFANTEEQINNAKNKSSLLFSASDFVGRVSILLNQVCIYFNLQMDDFLIPPQNYCLNITEITLRDDYKNMEFIKRPTSFTRIDNVEEPVVLNDNIYEFCEIVKWIKSTGIDPITTKKVSLKDIKIIAKWLSPESLSKISVKKETM